MNAASVRVAILSRSPLIEAGLRLMLAHEDVVVAAPARHLVLRGGDCDVVLVDLIRPGGHRELWQQVVEAQLPVVALGNRSGGGWEEPWDGVVRKVLPLSVSKDDLVAALLRAADRVPGPGPRSAALSERELDILALVGAGHSNAQIGAELFLSLNTVKSYIRTAYRKIDVHTRSQAVLWTIDHDLLARRPLPRRSPEEG